MWTSKPGHLTPGPAPKSPCNQTEGQVTVDLKASRESRSAFHPIPHSSGFPSSLTSSTSSRSTVAPSRGSKPTAGAEPREAGAAAKGSAAIWRSGTTSPAPVEETKPLFVRKRHTLDCLWICCKTSNHQIDRSCGLDPHHGMVGGFWNFHDLPRVQLTSAQSHSNPPQPHP